MGVTVIFTQDFDQDFDHEKNENKIWVVRLETTLHGYTNGWIHPEKSRPIKTVDDFLYYFRVQNIEIHDVIIRIFDHSGLYSICEALYGCPPTIDLFVLVNESDVESMLNFGFSIAKGNDTTQIGLYSCNIGMLNQSISIDNNCSRYGEPIVHFFQLTENLK